jgi:aromatic-amino-acid transaminase
MGAAQQDAQHMTLSPFSEVPLAPADPILGLTEAFQADKNPNKVNLGVGVYQDGRGKVPVLSVVREAERRWYEKEDSKSYLPIDGLPSYRQEVQALLFGRDSSLVKEGRVVTAQALGGTGALKLGADFLRRFLPQSELYISQPSWENHRALFEAAGFAVKEYPYYSPKTHGLDFAAMRDALSTLPAQTVVLLHACCHNPTGADLSPEQWQEVVEIAKARALVPFIDFAYQGFGDGIEQDAYAARALASAGVSFFIANSFSKSMSVYGERCGALSVVCPTPQEAQRVLGQLKLTVQRIYSSPAIHAAGIVARVLSDTRLRPMWEAEVAQMRERIQAMRRALHEVLSARVPERDFNYLLTQRGMFSYTGLSAAQVDRLRDEHAVYLIRSGRMCVAGLNRGNVERTAQAFAAVLAS